MAESLQPGQSYTFSVWARAEATTAENICVVLWGVGEGSQHGQTCTSIGQTWTLVSAPYDVTASGLTELRAQVYLGVAGLALDLAGASLVDDALENASFERGDTAGWLSLEPPGGILRRRPEESSGLPEGSSLLDLSTTRTRGSLYQDVPVQLVPGQSYTFSVWARADANVAETICVVLWGMGDSTRNGQTCTSIGQAWTLVAAPYDVSAPGLTRLRAQVYLSDRRPHPAS